MHLRFFLFIMLFSGSLSGQDTVSFYFALGKSKLIASQEKTLNKLPLSYNLEAVDTVLFIGMADTNGAEEMNFSLSEQRAANVERFARTFLPKKIQKKIIARGEKASSNIGKSRRVDMVLVYQKDDGVTSEGHDWLPEIADDGLVEDMSVEQDRPACMKIEAGFLRKAAISTYVKRGQEIVLIQAEGPKPPELYYGAWRNDSSTYPVKLRWKLRTTGEDWWQRKRWETACPKTFYDEFRVFSISDPPCVACADSTGALPYPKALEPCWDHAYMVEHNLQVRKPVFNRKVYEVRTPRVFVRQKKKYIASYAETHDIEWDFKRAKKKANYYYTRIPNEAWNPGGQSIYTRGLCCPSEDDVGAGIRSLKPLDKDQNKPKYWRVSIEGGSYVFPDELEPYVGFTLIREDEHVMLELLGATTLREVMPLSALRFRVHFFDMTWPFVGSVHSFHRPGELEETSTLFRFYAGSGIRSAYAGFIPNSFNQDAHLGLSLVREAGNMSFSRFFIQAGAGYDYSGLISDELFPVFHGGLVYDLVRF